MKRDKKSKKDKSGREMEHWQIRATMFHFTMA